MYRNPSIRRSCRGMGQKLDPISSKARKSVSSHPMKTRAQRERRSIPQGKIHQGLKSIRPKVESILNTKTKMTLRPRNLKDCNGGKQTTGIKGDKESKKVILFNKRLVVKLVRLEDCNLMPKEKQQIPWIKPPVAEKTKTQKSLGEEKENAKDQLEMGHGYANNASYVLGDDNLYYQYPAYEPLDLHKFFDLPYTYKFPEFDFKFN